MLEMGAGIHYMLYKFSPFAVELMKLYEKILFFSHSLVSKNKMNARKINEAEEVTRNYRVVLMFSWYLFVCFMEAIPGV